MPRSRASRPRSPARAISALNRAAFCLFQLVAGGELGEAEVVERLVDACHRNGLVKDDGLRLRSRHHPQRAPAGLQYPRARDRVHHEHSRTAPVSERRDRRISLPRGERLPPHHPRGADRLGQDHHRRRDHPREGRALGSPCSSSRIGVRSSPRPPRSYTISASSRHHPGGLSRAPARGRAGRVDPNAAPARDSAETMDLAAGRSPGDRRSHHCPANTYQEIIEAYPEAILARFDGNAMPRRRARAWRHLRDHHRMPASRRR